jgi:hypothetical protein
MLTQLRGNEGNGTHSCGTLSNYSEHQDRQIKMEAPPTYGIAFLREHDVVVPTF